MANIAGINGIVIANVAGMNGVVIANMASINGNNIGQELGPGQFIFDGNLFYTEGDADWFEQSTTYNTSPTALQSGDITDSQVSKVSLLNFSTGGISFYWKVSSELNWDFLKFYVNDVVKASISGDVNWTLAGPFYIEAGDTVYWQYEKDSSTSDGLDTGWLDDFSIDTEYVPPTTLDVFGPTYWAIDAGLWETPPGYYQSAGGEIFQQIILHGIHTDVTDGITTKVTLGIQGTVPSQTLDVNIVDSNSGDLYDLPDITLSSVGTTEYFDFNLNSTGFGLYEINILSSSTFYLYSTDIVKAA